MTEYTYCPKCGAELTDYYNSIFELNVRDNIWVDVPVRQADCTNCDEQILTPISEKLIDYLRIGKRAIKPFAYSDVYLFTIFQYINTYGKLPDSFWDVYAYFDDSSITKEEYIGIYGELKICETCKQLIWKSYGKWMLRSYVYPADKINPGIVVGRCAEIY